MINFEVYLHNQLLLSILHNIQPEVNHSNTDKFEENSIHNALLDANNSMQPKEMQFTDHFVESENIRTTRTNHINALEFEDRIRIQNIPSDAVISKLQLFN